MTSNKESVAMSAEKIVILDFENGKVFIRPVPMSLIEDDAQDVVEYYADELGIREGECQYMVVNSDDFLDVTN